MNNQPNPESESDIEPPEWLMLAILGLWACAARLADLASDKETKNSQ